MLPAEKNILLYFLLTISLGNMYAQPIGNNTGKANHFLEVGLGMNSHAIRDKGTSPLLYKGLLPAVHLQYLLTKSNFIGIINENFYIGYLKTRNYQTIDNNKALSINNDLTFTALFRVKSRNRINFYAGGELGTLANVRLNDKFNNANLNYEIMVSLGPSAMLEYNTSWKSGRINLGLVSFKKRDRNLKFQYSMSMPVLTNVLRPGYATINDFVDNNNYTIKLDEFKLTSFKNLFMFRNRFTLYYILRNNNMLKFNYDFNYFSYYNTYNPVRGINSSLMFSIVFRFTNN